MRDGLVRRYHTAEGTDGLPPGEGVFIACSFWLADNYILQNRMIEARCLFERLLNLRNDVGLLAEEYDPVDRRQLGNFPQGFSHLALVNTAHNLVNDRGIVHLRSMNAPDSKTGMDLVPRKIIAEGQREHEDHPEQTGHCDEADQSLRVLEIHQENGEDDGHNGGNDEIERYVARPERNVGRTEIDRCEN